MPTGLCKAARHEQKKTKLRAAARAGLPAPMDLRFVPKKSTHKQAGKNKRQVETRAAIVEFLEELIHTMAEPMPTSTTPRTSDGKKIYDGPPKKRLRSFGTKPRAKPSRRAEGQAASDDDENASSGNLPRLSSYSAGPQTQLERDPQSFLQGFLAWGNSIYFFKG